MEQVRGEVFFFFTEKERLWLITLLQHSQKETLGKPWHFLLPIGKKPQCMNTFITNFGVYAPERPFASSHQRLLREG